MLVLNPINRGFYEGTVVYLPIHSEFSLGTPHSFFMLFCVVLTIVKSLNSSIFRWKLVLTKKGKMDLKWPEATVFKVFPKIFALRFSGFGVKWKFISLIFACRNPMTEKILVLELWAQMLPAKQIAGFWNYVRVKCNLIS